MINYGQTLEEPPVYEPISVDELKAHLRLNIDDEDDLIVGWITAARTLVEEFTGRQISPATWKFYFDQWPDLIPKAPTTSIEEITYYDSNNEEQTLDEDSYRLDNTTEPARLFIDTKPTLGTRKPTVIITVTCGYEAVPETLKHCITLLAGNYYLFRTGSLPTLGAIRTIPYAMQAVLASYKVHY